MRKNFESSFIEEDIEAKEARLALVVGIKSPGMTVKEDSDGEPSELLVDMEIPYPKKGTRDYSKAGRILLLEVSKARHPSGGLRRFKLPENATTLSNILNEASGTTESMGVSPAESRTIRTIVNLIRTFKIDLESVADNAHMLPMGLDYDQLLVEKETSEIKLLPPVVLEDVGKSERDKRIRELGRMFLNSLMEGATNPSQRELSEVLKPEIKEIFH